MSASTVCDRRDRRELESDTLLVLVHYPSNVTYLQIKMSPQPQPSIASLKWTSPEALIFLKNLLSKCIPAWPSGPHEWQITASAWILDGHDQLVVAGCGEVKTAVAYLHIIVLLELLKDPSLPRFGLKTIPARPITLIASPLTDLSLSQVSICVVISGVS